MTIHTFVRFAWMWTLVISACSRDRSERTDAVADSSSVQDSAVRIGAAASGQVVQGAPNSDSLLAAMEAVEESLRVHGDDSAFAPLYLRLGRMKKAYEGRLSYGSPAMSYALAHPAEYNSNEVDADYIYNGYHFRELMRRFPKSEWADDAAWELTLLSRGGECEGNVACYIGRGFDPVAEFLRDYPTSPFAQDAAQRADSAFTQALADVVDLTEPSDDYSPGEVRELLARYDTLVQRLPTPLRTRATLTIADLWSRFLNRERARVLYGWLLATAAPGIDTADVGQRLRAFGGATFVLNPARIVSDRRVELSWDAPPEGTIRSYVVLRSETRESGFQPIAELDPGARSYGDTGARAGTGYWYRVRALAASTQIASNPVHAATPSDALDARALIFNPTDRTLYIFGYLENGFPRVLQVSERGRVTARDGALYGVEHYAQLDHRFDSYVDEAWFVDVAGQAFIKFPKTGTTFRNDLAIAIQAGATEVGADTASMPYYGIVASVNPSARRMWVARRGGAYSLAWDYKHGIAWEGRERGIRQLDAAGKTIREIALPSRSSGENEFVMGMWADLRSGAAWAYLSRKKALIRIDSSGAVTQSLPLERYLPGDLRSIAFDFAHGWVWAVTGAVTQRRLVRFALADGRVLHTSPLADLRGLPYLAPDTTTGRLWLLDDNRLATFDSNGALLFQATVPTR